MFVTEESFTSHYFHNDYLGSARLMTKPADQAHIVEWRRDYYPYGADKTMPYGGDHYKFTGKERDAEIGLDYSCLSGEALAKTEHRYYDYDLGRFTQVDPLSAKYPGLSPYIYSADNPVIFVDPTGLSTHVANDGTTHWVDDDDSQVYYYSDLATASDWDNDLIGTHSQILGTSRFSDEFKYGGTISLETAADGTVTVQDVSIEMAQLINSYGAGSGSSQAIIAALSSPFMPLDVKRSEVLEGCIGFYYDGEIMTKQSIGNRIAGMNAAIGGTPLTISLILAGGLHQLTNPSENWGPLSYPTFGEQPYTARQFIVGYRRASIFNR